MIAFRDSCVTDKNVTESINDQTTCQIYSKTPISKRLEY